MATGEGAIAAAAEAAVRVLVLALESVHDTVIGRYGRAPDPRLTALLRQLDAISVEPSQVSQVSGAKPEVDQSSFAAPGSTLLMSVGDGATGAVRGMNTASVAALTGISPQAVRQAARAGRLAGRRTDLGWQFTDVAVKAWRDKRITDNELET